MNQITIPQYFLDKNWNPLEELDTNIYILENELQKKSILMKFFISKEQGIEQLKLLSGCFSSPVPLEAEELEKLSKELPRHTYILNPLDYILINEKELWIQIVDIYQMAIVRNYEKSDAKYITISFYQEIEKKLQTNTWHEKQSLYDLIKAFYETTGQTKSKMLEKKAKEGDGISQWKYGNKLYDSDKEQALRWYEKSAEQGCVLGMSSLGDYYSSQKGCEQQAISWYEKAANKDWDFAKEKLALIYWERKDLEKTVYWCKKAIQTGFFYQDIYYIMAQLYEKGEGVEQNWEKAVQYYQMLAKGMHKEAQFRLAELYEEGKVVSRDDKKAFELYCSCAEFMLIRNLEACYRVGKMYEEGRGIEKNDKKAVEWYQKAATNYGGLSKAQKSLAKLYWQGIDGEKNKEKAIALYENLAFKGDIESAYELGKIYEWKYDNLSHLYSYDDRRSFIESAFYWYQRAAEQGYIEATVGFVRVYRRKRMPKNVNEAIHVLKYFETAAELGDVELQEYLGNVYEYGLGEYEAGKNIKKSFYWYQKAAMNGNKQAQYKVGVFYEQGIAVQKNIKEAFFYYDKSAKQGHAEASKKLNMLKFKLCKLISK